MSTQQELHDAVAVARRAEVERVLGSGVDVNARGVEGVTALHVAAAGGHAALSRFLAAPFDVDLATILPRESNHESNQQSKHAAIAELLLDRGADKDAQTSGGASPLMVASFFGRADVAAVLRARGANDQLRDRFGRTAARLAIFQAVAHAIRVAHGQPAVAAASMAQVYFPDSDTYSAPILGLALAGELPRDTFATWPTDHPFAAVVPIGDSDLLSRLMTQAPNFVRAASPGAELARAIAAGVAGVARELPRAPPDDATTQGLAHVVVLPDGRVPVLVFEWGPTLAVLLPDRKHWPLPPGTPHGPVVRGVVKALATWSAATPAAEVTRFELTSDLCAHLSAERGETWRVTPGAPSAFVDLRLHADPDAGSIGLPWPGGIELDWRSSSIPIPSRDGLVALRAQVLASARAQRARYDENVAMAARVSAAVRSLAERLAARLETSGGTCAIDPFSSPNHAWVPPQRITCRADEATASVDVRCEGGELRVRAGLPAVLGGWRGVLDGSDETFASVVAAVEEDLRTLTADKLVSGRAYRVLEPFKGLARGAIVTFVGYNDIDNHYGEYELTDAAGKLVTIGGDFSNGPHGTWFGKTGRYLEPTEPAKL